MKKLCECGRGMIYSTFSRPECRECQRETIYCPPVPSYSNQRKALHDRIVHAHMALYK